MSTSSSPNQGLPDFATLAEKLQEAAQALLVLSSPGTMKSDEPPPLPAREKAPSEIRSFRIPGYMVAKEKQMLEMLKAENWQEMFDKTYDQLYTLALLMQHFETDEKIDGFSVQQMGNTLMAPLDMLSRLCSLVADFKPVAAEH